MSDNLRVIEIQPTNIGIEVKVGQYKAGQPKMFKIPSHGQILIRHKIISTEQLKIGDEILAYGVDMVPSKQYN